MIENKNIIQYYKEIHALKRYGDFDLNEINSMFPYEIDIYSAMTVAAIEKEKQAIQNKRNK